MRRQFEHFQMEKLETVSRYFNKVLTLVNQIRANVENMRDFHIMEKILWTLMTQFKYVVATIEELKDFFTMTVDKLMGSL